jgi:error-prone DNA polymerase
LDGFVHLDVRSYFSLKDGAFSPEDLAVRAAELGMPAVAMTDRDGLYGAARFVHACQKVGVRPILGSTLTVRDEVASARPGSPRLAPLAESTVVLLARDATGYGNLCRLITDAHHSGERGDPHLFASQLLAHPEGLVCLLGPDSVPGRLARSGAWDGAASAARSFREAFGDSAFVSVRNRLEPGSRAELRALLRLASDAGLRALATNGVRYLVREDAFLADALECMRAIVPLAANHVSRTNGEGYLKSAAEMRERFSWDPSLCDTAVEVAESCSFDLGIGRIHFPDFPTPAGRSAGSLLAERCWRGMEDRRMQSTREVRDRLDHELAMIQTMGYAAYFLTVADIVADIKSMGIRCACRGSAAGSLVCYLTGISDVDPVRHGLLFERFMNPQRDDLPDVDVDVESARREDVYDMVLSRYGEDRSACVNMVDTYRARGAIREVGKALGFPESEIGVVAKAFPHISAHHIREAMDRLPELKGMNLNAGQLERVFTVAERLNGFPRHIALHPCGIVLSKDDLLERTPLERSAQGYRMVQADKDDVELLGLLKLDVLGVRMLSTMRHCLDEVARTDAEKVDLSQIDLDDQKAWSLIRSSRTLGCFQIESPGQRELLQKFQPTKWEDLIVDISLFRPGPVKSDMVSPFLRRYHGLEPVIYRHPGLREALGETHGVIVYHEQVMRTLQAVAGYDLVEADRIRRHLDDGLEVEAIQADFLRRVRERGTPKADADKLWAELFSFASFGFCKAHAAAFAVPTYQSAWLKAHYPAHFLAGVLTHEPGMYPRRLIVEDAREHGVAILPLDVNRSEELYTVEPVEPPETPPDPDDLSRIGEGTGIRMALRDVEGISGAEVRSVLQARADRSFRDVSDFLRRANVSRPVVEAIAHAGGFDLIGGGTRRDRLYLAMVTDVPARENEQLALTIAAEPEPPGLREYTDAERVRAELEVLQVDASRHLMSFYEPLLEDLGVIRSPDLRKHRSDEWVMVAGVKVASQTPAVRSGQRIIFLTLDDATGPVDVTVFERVQPWCARTVFHGFVLAVWGRLRRTGIAGVSIVAEQVWDLPALHRARNEGRLAEALREGAGSDALPEAGPKLYHHSGGSAGG